MTPLVIMVAQACYSFRIVTLETLLGNVAQIKKP